MEKIREIDFIVAEDSRLKELAEYIRTSGLSAYAIAKGCRISWRTVCNAMNGIPVRGCTESRIRFFLKQYKNNGNSEN